MIFPSSTPLSHHKSRFAITFPFPLSCDNDKRKQLNQRKFEYLIILSASLTLGLLFIVHSSYTADFFVCIVYLIIVSYKHETVLRLLIRCPYHNQRRFHQQLSLKMKNPSLPMDYQPKVSYSEYNILSVH